MFGYLNLRLNFNSISDVLLKKLVQFERNGFDPSNGFIFGFSVGAQLAINAGRDFGGKLDAIDGKILYIFLYLTYHTYSYDNKLKFVFFFHYFLKLAIQLVQDFILTHCFRYADRPN